jgi:hypothetical protein
MGKRSPNFERVANDAYDTPARAVWPLLAHLDKDDYFAEPCAGQGNLIRHLHNDHIFCAYASDIAPRRASTRLERICRIEKRDALKITKATINHCDVIITNPPWTRLILHAIIEHFISIKPAWYLFDADWMHNGESAWLLRRCSKIVAIGRVKWIPGSLAAGKDNSCWYYFPGGNWIGQPTFYGRKG